jgi:uncharacterized protein (TIGR02145 family)
LDLIDTGEIESVTIDTQVWMKKNLDVNHFCNGDPIPEAKTNEEWENAGKKGNPAWCYYNNDPEMGQHYGKLYNWFAVNDPRGLAPAGWHVASDDEWTELIDYVEAQGYSNSTGDCNGAGNALKSCRQINAPQGSACKTSAHPRWDSDEVHYGFDKFGFSALPGGYRDPSGSFGYIGNYGDWWSATEFSGTNAWGRYMDYSSGNVYRYCLSNKTNGWSVRCIRDSDIAEGSGDYRSPETEQEFDSVKIGSQIWMKRNLDVSRFRNGDPIPEAKTYEDWEKAGEKGKPAWCFYNKDPEMSKHYGKLYNWFAVNDPRGLAPEGWHVANDDEWTQLVNYVEAQGYPNACDPKGAGNALKSCRQINSPLGDDCNRSIHPRWNPDEENHGFDKFGFSALPGGAYYGGISFSGLGKSGYWWTASENSYSDAKRRLISYDDGNVHSYFFDKAFGFSVRCLKDD